MLKKPEFIPQPQGNTQNPSNISLQATNTEEKPTTTLETAQNKIDLPVSNNELVIKKKKQYRQFIRLIKEGKFTTAMLTAKLIGVQRNTIMEWLETSKAKAAMNEEVNTYVKKISISKDWKAQAYLLDKLEGQDKTEQQSVNLTNLIQINTVSPSQE